MTGCGIRTAMCRLYGGRRRDGEKRWRWKGKKGGVKGRNRGDKEGGKGGKSGGKEEERKKEGEKGGRKEGLREGRERGGQVGQGGKSQDPTPAHGRSCCSLLRSLSTSTSPLFPVPLSSPTYTRTIQPIPTPPHPAIRPSSSPHGPPISPAPPAGAHGRMRRDVRIEARLQQGRPGRARGGEPRTRQCGSRHRPHGLGGGAGDASKRTRRFRR
eukprot:366090-Chlamydomonas_euryale.AAC.11